MKNWESILESKNDCMTLENQDYTGAKRHRCYSAAAHGEDSQTPFAEVKTWSYQRHAR